MSSVDKQCSQLSQTQLGSQAKWLAGSSSRVKDITPLPEGWLDYFFTTGSVIPETGCMEKQCKIIGCQKTYKGSNGITSNFAKHVRKSHPQALKRFAEENQQWKHRDRIGESGGKRTEETGACGEPQLIVVNSELNDEAESDAGEAAYENDNDAAACDSESQHSVNGALKPSGDGSAGVLLPASVRKVNLNSAIAPSLRKRKLAVNGCVGRARQDDSDDERGRRPLAWDPAEPPLQDAVGRLACTAAELVHAFGQRERDEQAAFGQLVVSELRAVCDERVRDTLKIQIMSLIYEAKRQSQTASCSSNHHCASSDAKQCSSGAESDEPHD